MAVVDFEQRLALSVDPTREETFGEQTEYPSPIDITPSIAPSDWQLDIKRMQDAKLTPLLRLGYLPLEPKRIGSPNRGITSWPQMYQRDFGKREVVFLWQMQGNGTNGNGNGYHEPEKPKVIPLLYCNIGKDSNETSDNPGYILSRQWESDGHCRTPKDRRHMETAYNYHTLINNLRENGTMPKEWTWEYKVAYWEENIKPLNEYDYTSDPNAEIGTIAVQHEERTAAILPPENIKPNQQKSREGRKRMILNLIDHYLKLPNLTTGQKEEIATALAKRAVEISQEIY